MKRTLAQRINSSEVMKFRKYENARFMANEMKAGAVLLGDCDDNGGMFFVCTLGLAEKLVKAGYEYAR